MRDIITFTKQLSGIDDLVTYVIDYIDQNMILYRILCDVDCTVTKTINTNPNTMEYSIDGIKKEDMNRLQAIPGEQEVVIYNVRYRVNMIPSFENNNLLIRISVT